MKTLNPAHYDAIIFDLGGVILNIDYQLAEKAFENLGISSFSQLYSQAKQSRIFDELEMGLISPEVFRERLKVIAGLTIRNEEIDEAWNSMLLDLPEHRLVLLEKIREKTKVFLLSNTNEIHIAAFQKIIDNSCGWNRFENCFDKMYFSSRVQMRKPDKKIFEFVLKENDLEPSKTLFIDDSAQHVEGALKTGIKALLLPKGNTIEELFSVG